MIHRHVTVPNGTRVKDLPLAAIVDILDRGDLADWQPLAIEIARDPTGQLAETVLRLVDAYPMYGTSRLWRLWIEHRGAQDPDQY